MNESQKLSDETKMLFRIHALRVARKKHPDATIDVRIGDYLDESGRVARSVTINPQTNDG